MKLVNFSFVLPRINFSFVLPLISCHTKESNIMYLNHSNTYIQWICKFYTHISSWPLLLEHYFLYEEARVLGLIANSAVLNECLHVDILTRGWGGILPSRFRSQGDLLSKQKQDPLAWTFHAFRQVKEEVKGTAWIQHPLPVSLCAEMTVCVCL